MTAVDLNPSILAAFKKLSNLHVSPVPGACLETKVRAVSWFLFAVNEAPGFRIPICAGFSKEMQL